MNSKNAAAIIIGNELLSGKIADLNAVYLAHELRSLGVDLQRIVIIPDDVKHISEETVYCRGKYDLIFTSGGVGPTHDDVTMAGIAEAVGQPLIQHPELTRLLKEIYRGVVTPTQMALALVPEGIELLYAEGLRIPVLHFDEIYILPGIPELFVKKFEAIKERFREPPYYLKKIYFSDDEITVAEDLKMTLKRFPNILLGSYPISHQPDYKMIITIESKDKIYLEEAVKSLTNLLPGKKIIRVEQY
ncbi:MAG: competence/damage-inducible protein A [Nitrospira sp.]|nr:competence/damage-inducible protein A [Candidatus Manganitrophaceae bacterium]HIL33997.1 competence/damage-inducible protein A [Candidatus Manganitrophaceae bacterium]